MSDKQNEVGRILKEEREKRGLKLEMIHEATKVPLDSLKAIEEGYKVRTLTTFYFRSFVRIYAQYLGLDPKPLLEMIPKTSSKPKSFLDPRSNAPRKMAPSVHTPISNRLEEVSSMGLFAHATKPRFPMKIVKIIVSGLVIVLVFMMIRGCTRMVFRSKKSSSSATEEKKGTLVKAEKAEIKKAKAPKVEKKKTARRTTVRTVASQPKVAAEAKTSTTKAVERPPLKAVMVTIRTRSRSWLNVKVDGQTVFQNPIQKGEVETWSGDEKIEISGKDLNELEFEINGESLGRISRRNANAKKVIITRKGWSIE